LCISCAKPKPNPFLLSPSYNIQILELQDHQFCSSLKIDYDQTLLLQNRLYWGCRLSITKRHIVRSRSPNAITHNSQLNNLINQIDIKLINLPESIIYHSNIQVDEAQHKKCLELGYEVATQDNAKIDDYFGCRSTLIEEYKLLPPYRDAKYMKYPNKSYNLNFAINSQIEKKIAEYNKQKEEYPSCVKHNIYNPNFKLCTKAEDSSRKCYKEIKKSRYQKELKEKLNCQRRSYVHFSNNMIKLDDEESDSTKKTNKKSDYYNNNNFAALGIDVESFRSKEEEKLVEDETENIKDPLSINNDNELYTKFEITKLRERYIIKCQKDVDKSIEIFVKEEEFKCEELKKFKRIGE